MYTKVGLACTGACLSEKTRDGGQGTQVALLWKLLRRLAPWAPPATPAPPPDAVSRTLEASFPPEHLLHGCTYKFNGFIRRNATCSVNAM
jgi:hypothetical protein